MHVAFARLADKLRPCCGFTSDDLRALAALKPHTALFPAGSTILEASRRSEQVYLIRSGWAACHRDLHTGSRQVLN